MATIKNKWLLIPKDNRPEWWVTKQTVRIQPYGNSGSYALMPSTINSRDKGYSTITPKFQLYSGQFIDGDYRVLPHDNGAIVIIPTTGDNPDPETDKDPQDSQELKINPMSCNIEDSYLWAMGQAVQKIVSGRIPQSLVQTLQFYIDSKEKLFSFKKDNKLPAIEDQDSLKILREMAVDKTISESVRKSILIELAKRETKTGKKERKTIVMETNKGKKNASNS